MLDKNHLYSLDHGDDRLEYIKHCISDADKENNQKDALELRFQYIEESVIYGDAFKAFIMFPEFMSLFDEHPDIFPKLRFMIALKWVIGCLNEFYQVPVAKGEQFLEELKKRCIEYGYSLKIFYHKASFFYLRTHNYEKAKKYFDLFINSESDALSDCEACELSFRTEFELCTGSEKKAIKMFNELLNNNMHCAEVPEITYSFFTNHFAAKGRLDEAEYYASILKRRLKDKDELNVCFFTLLRFYSYTSPNEAFEIFQKKLTIFLNLKNPYERFEFADAAFRFFKNIDSENDHYINLKIPHSFPLYSDNDEYKINELRDYFYNEAKMLAEKFDKRNNNSYFSDKLNLTYQSTSNVKLDLPKHGTVPRIPFKAAVPFLSRDNIPSPEEIVNVIKDLPNTVVVSIFFDEEHGIMNISGRNTDYGFHFKYSFSICQTANIENAYQIHFFSETETEKLSDYNTLLLVYAVLENGYESFCYGHLLKVLNALNYDHCPAVADITNEGLLSAEWVRLYASTEAVPDYKYLFLLHVYTSEEDEQCYDIVTSGLTELGSREISVSGAEKKDLDFVTAVTGHIADAIATVAPLRDEGEPFEFGMFFDNKSIVKMTWIPEENESELNEQKYDKQYAIPMIYISSSDYHNRISHRINDIPEEIRGQFDFRSSNYQKYIREELARAFLDRAVEIYNSHKDLVTLVIGMDVESEEDTDNSWIYMKTINDKLMIYQGVDGSEKYSENSELDFSDIVKDDVFFWELKYENEIYMSDDLYLLKDL